MAKTGSLIILLEQPGFKRTVVNSGITFRAYQSPVPIIDLPEGQRSPGKRFGRLFPDDSLFVTSLLISIRDNVPSSYKIQGDKGLIQIFFTPEQGKLIYHGLATGQDAPDTYWKGSESTTITHLQLHFWKNVF